MSMHGNSQGIHITGVRTMKPIINPWLIYFVDSLDLVQVSCVLMILALVVAILILTARISDFGVGEEKELKSARRTRKIVIFFSILLLIVFPFIPSRETCYKMIIASQITNNNIQKAEDIIKGSVDYIFEKINKE